MTPPVSVRFENANLSGPTADTLSRPSIHQAAVAQRPVHRRADLVAPCQIGLVSNDDIDGNERLNRASHLSHATAPISSVDVIEDHDQIDVRVRTLFAASKRAKQDDLGGVKRFDDLGDNER